MNQSSELSSTISYTKHYQWIRVLFTDDQRALWHKTQGQHRIQWIQRRWGARKSLSHHFEANLSNVSLVLWLISTLHSCWPGLFCRAAKPYRQAKRILLRGGWMMITIFRVVESLAFYHPQYMTTMRLEDNNIFDIFCSTQYLPLNELLFLRVHNFVQLIQSSFPMIVHCVLFCNEHVVWYCCNDFVDKTMQSANWFNFSRSDVNPKDLYSINEYMHSTFFVKLHQGQSNLCSFARGSLADLAESTECAGLNRVAPIIHIYNGNKVRKFQLLVYRLLDGVICLLVDGQFV